MTRPQRFACLLACCLALTAATAAAQEYWGAFARSLDTSGTGKRVYGLSWNYPTREEAVAEAFRQCRKQAGGPCRYHEHASVMWFSTTDTLQVRCLAVTEIVHSDGSSSFGKGTGDTPAQAEMDALRWLRGRDVQAEVVEVVCNAQ